MVEERLSVMAESSWRNEVRLAACLLVAVLVACATCGCNNKMAMPDELPVMYGITAVDSSHAWAVGGNGSVLFFNGNKWRPQRGVLLSGGTYPALRAVSACDILHVWAVGDRGTVAFFNGRSWTNQPSRTDKDLYGICAVDPFHAWDVGASGTIQFYDGAGWRSQKSGVIWGLRSVSGVGNKVWASGDQGILANEGEWRRQYTSSGTVSSVYACGDTAVASENSGVQTASMPVSSVLIFDGNWSKLSAIPDIWINAVICRDRESIWVAGSPAAVLYYDGTNWTEDDHNDAEYLGLAALDRSHVWVVGKGSRRGGVGTGVIYYYNGEEWHQQYVEKN